MPEFVMEGRDHASRAESDFVFGYIEAAFFTADEDMPGELGYTDLSPESIATVREDCAAWQEKHKDLLGFAYSIGAGGYCERQAGRDFWFTRNGHGVGFLDREELTAIELARRDDGALTDEGEGEGLDFLGTLGEMLTDAAEKAGEVSLVWDGSTVYIS